MKNGGPSTYFALMTLLFKLAIIGHISAASALLPHFSSRTQKGSGAKGRSWDVLGSTTAGPDMTTPWSKDVNPLSPLPEYPRPQLRREDWLNLNGVWEFEATASWDARLPPFNTSLSDKITVPYPPESALSGFQRSDVGMERMWYRRTFNLPGGAAWEGKSVLLHFGAVDFETSVYVNQRLMGQHRGGYNKFSFDITEALEAVPEGPHEIVVEVFDPTEFAHIAIGKQRRWPGRHPSSIWYTATSGIWQTVWIEPVPKAHIVRLDLIPDIDSQVLSITVHGSPGSEGTPFTARASYGSEFESAATGIVGKEIQLSISNPRLWSPSEPNLYNLTVTLSEAPASLLESSFQESADSVEAYFGMRKVSVGTLPGSDAPRVLLNNKFLFWMGMLDQGFWPDGIYTAATDEALVWDIKFAKSLGYNMLRKHIKIEPDRWYYHADRLGILVWQDHPCMFFPDSSRPTAVESSQWEDEFKTMVQQHLSVPSIVQYTVFNEGWGQYDTLRVTNMAKTWDPSRLFDPASGWVDAPAGDVVDMHKYTDPGSPTPSGPRAAVLGEFGGIGLRIADHEWIPEDSISYEWVPDCDALQARYLGLVDQLADLMEDGVASLSAAVYTQLADVEAEVNGQVTYDRRVTKVDVESTFLAHSKLIQLSETMNENFSYRKDLARADLLDSEISTL